MDLWRLVLDSERVWSSPKAIHKMGWLHPGDVVHLVEEYKGWYRINYEDSNAVDLLPPSGSYPEHWVKDRPDGEPAPLFGPVPEPPAPSLWERIIDAIVRILSKIFGARF